MRSLRCRLFGHVWYSWIGWNHAESAGYDLKNRPVRFAGAFMVQVIHDRCRRCGALDPDVAEERSIRRHARAIGKSHWSLN